jgi:hypothetical protein
LALGEARDCQRRGVDKPLSTGNVLVHVAPCYQKADRKQASPFLVLTKAADKYFRQTAKFVHLVESGHREIQTSNPTSPVAHTSQSRWVYRADKDVQQSRGDEMMANADHLIEWRTGRNQCIGYVKSDNGRSRPLYYVQRNAMDWILDRECLRVATGSSMGELQEIAERQEQKSKLQSAEAECTRQP